MPKTTPRLDSEQALTPTATRSEGRRLAALYRTFGPVIYSRCRRTLHDEQLAVSATQEVFIRALRDLHTADTRSAVEVLTSECELVCRETLSAAS